MDLVSAKHLLAKRACARLRLPWRVTRVFDDDQPKLGSFRAQRRHNCSAARAVRRMPYPAGRASIRATHFQKKPREKTSPNSAPRNGDTMTMNRKNSRNRLQDSYRCPGCGGLVDNSDLTAIRDHHQHVLRPRPSSLFTLPIVTTPVAVRPEICQPRAGLADNFTVPPGAFSRGA